MDESQRKQIWKMRAEGLGYGLIGKATGLSRDSVKKYEIQHYMVMERRQSKW